MWYVQELHHSPPSVKEWYRDHIDVSSTLYPLFDTMLDDASNEEAVRYHNVSRTDVLTSTAAIRVLHQAVAAKVKHQQLFCSKKDATLHFVRLLATISDYVRHYNFVEMESGGYATSSGYYDVFFTNGRTLRIDVGPMRFFNAAH